MPTKSSDNTFVWLACVAAAYLFLGSPFLIAWFLLRGDPAKALAVFRDVSRTAKSIIDHCFPPQT